MPSIDPLAIEQTFSQLDIKTSAKTKLNEAKKEFQKKNLTKSANLFLESWRILQSEYERNLYEPDHLQEDRVMVQENKARMLLSFIALHDLAIACSRNTAGYKDKDGNCKLEVYALQYGWSRDTIDETLDIDNGDKSKPVKKGSPITALGLRIKDPVGRLLDTAESFNDAAKIVARLCSLQVACVSDPFSDQREGYKFIESSLLFIRMLSSGRNRVERIKRIRDNQNNPEGERFGLIRDKNNPAEDEEDDSIAVKARTKLRLKMEELESKRDPINNEEEEELIGLFKQCHIRPPWQNLENMRRDLVRPNKGLGQFHVPKELEQEVDKGEEGNWPAKWGEEVEWNKAQRTLEEKMRQTGEKIKQAEEIQNLGEDEELSRLFQRFHFDHKVR